ncbi:hypothetical protein [Spiroplasma endosymbiont of Nebria brevicollis]|uniref:hypothetical protein n=1 Tax=Spiroplasma endosymbiont of Nebria brevicollis TaxID=3066284 RepID=UPI00313F0DFB
MLLPVSADDPNIINFLGFRIRVQDFLAAAGGLALIIFLILLAILLIMYLRKRMTIKGYLSLEEKDYQVEDKILQIEHEISKIQRKFYSTKHVIKRTKKYFK